MRYGNDDQATQGDVETARKRSQRRVQLGVMSRQQLVALVLAGEAEIARLTAEQQQHRI